MTRTDVQRLYSLAGGRWWDPFRAQWELFWARNAVRDLDSLLRRYVTPEARVLDVGCGSGGWTIHQSHSARTVRSNSSFSLRKRWEGGSSVTLGAGMP